MRHCCWRQQHVLIEFVNRSRACQRQPFLIKRSSCRSPIATHHAGYEAPAHEGKGRQGWSPRAAAGCFVTLECADRRARAGRDAFGVQGNERCHGHQACATSRIEVPARRLPSATSCSCGDVEEQWWQVDSRRAPSTAQCCCQPRGLIIRYADCRWCTSGAFPQGVGVQLQAEVASLHGDLQQQGFHTRHMASLL